MLRLYHDNKIIVTFVMILLVGGPCGTNTKMIKNNVPLYGDQMLFGPSHKSDPIKYIL